MNPQIPLTLIAAFALAAGSSAAFASDDESEAKRERTKGSRVEEPAAPAPRRSRAEPRPRSEEPAAERPAVSGAERPHRARAEKPAAEQPAVERPAGSRSGARTSPREEEPSAPPARYRAGSRSEEPVTTGRRGREEDPSRVGRPGRTVEEPVAPRERGGVRDEPVPPRESRRLADEPGYTGRRGGAEEDPEAPVRGRGGMRSGDDPASRSERPSLPPRPASGERGLAARLSGGERIVRPREPEPKFRAPSRPSEGKAMPFAGKSREAREHFSGLSIAAGGSAKAGFVNVAAGFSMKMASDQPASGGPLLSVPAYPAAGAGGGGASVSGGGSIQHNRPDTHPSVHIQWNYNGGCPSYYNTYYAYSNVHNTHYSSAWCHSWHYAAYYEPSYCWPSTRWRTYRVGGPWWTGCAVIGGVYLWTTAVYPWDEWNYNSCVVQPGFWDAEGGGDPYYVVTGASYEEDARSVRVLERQSVRRNRYDAVQVNRGVDLALRGQWEMAAKRWERALRANPRNSSAQYDLGVSYEIRGDFYHAISAYAEAVNLRPHARRYQIALEDLEDRFPNLAELVEEDMDERYGFFAKPYPPIG